ncbi:hypothetical protein TCELL_1153 [Thermogladius calderae 1633]|uniref:Uncharacterized protein n=1 Tax=Thermogladius calderae (strain DSM 22663 / VKM B-2946 / 1633) TaxID=1184251 RepID=I3TFN8_THEC1|nr:hypothetical protein [Thermogladius calderae]AFK51576.1 hypothetical protein TCELL_1153 [Thermogladius calderae 1633]
MPPSKELVEGLVDAGVRYLKRRLGHTELAGVEIKSSKINLFFRVREEKVVKVVINIRKNTIRVYSGAVSLDIGLKRVLQKVLECRGVTGGV